MNCADLFEINVEIWNSLMINYSEPNVAWPRWKLAVSLSWFWECCIMTRSEMHLSCFQDEYLKPQNSIRKAKFPSDLMPKFFRDCAAELWNGSENVPRFCLEAASRTQTHVKLPIFLRIWSFREDLTCVWSCMPARKNCTWKINVYSCLLSRCTSAFPSVGIPKTQHVMRRCIQRQAAGPQTQPGK